MAKKFTKSNKTKQYEKKASSYAKEVNNYPDFNYGNQAEYDAIIDKIINRDAFSYDTAGDALYENYKNQYTALGELAMKDTMGQASAMTGGYGSSYSQMAGQQAFNSYMNQLTEKIPELYQLAQNTYQMETDNLNNKFSVLSSDRQTQYGEYNDNYQKTADKRDYYNGKADSSYEKDWTEYDFKTNLAYQTARDAVSDSQWQKEFDYQKGRDAVSDSQWEKEYNLKKISSTTGNGSDVGGISNTSGTSLSSDEYKSVFKEKYSGKSIYELSKENPAIFMNRGEEGQARATAEALKNGKITTEEAQAIYYHIGQDEMAYDLADSESSISKYISDKSDTTTFEDTDAWKSTKTTAQKNYANRVKSELEKGYYPDKDGWSKISVTADENGKITSSDYTARAKAFNKKYKSFGVQIDTDFAFSSDKTYKQQAEERTKSGNIGTYDRITQFYSSYSSAVTSVNEYLKSGYSYNGETARKATTELYYECEETLKQLKSDKKAFVEKYGEKAYNQYVENLASVKDSLETTIEAIDKKRETVSNYRKSYADDESAKNAFDIDLNEETYFKKYSFKNFGEYQNALNKAENAYNNGDCTREQELEYLWLKDYMSRHGYKNESVYNGYKDYLDERINSAKNYENSINNVRNIPVSPIGVMNEKATKAKGANYYVTESGQKYYRSEEDKQKDIQALEKIKEEKYGNIDDLNAQKTALNQKRKEYLSNNWKPDDFDTITKSAEFDKKARKGANKSDVAENELQFYLNHKNASEADISKMTPAEQIVMTRGKGNHWDLLTDEEIKYYNYCIGNEEQNKAKKYLKNKYGYDMEQVLEARVKEDANKEFVEQYNNSEWYEKVLMNVVTVPANLLGNIGGFVKDVSDIVTHGTLTDYQNAIKDYSDKVRELTREDIDNQIDSEFWSKIATVGYDATMSSADMIFGSATLGGTGYGIAMGMGAASSYAHEAYDRGANTTQIVFGSLLTGVAEGLFEKYSLDKIVKMSTGGTFKSFVVNTLKSAGVEGSEEFFTEIADQFIDNVVMGANSNDSIRIRELMQKGYTRAQAQQLSAYENFEDAFWSFVTGAVSGAQFSMVGNTTSNIVASSEYKELGKKINENASIDSLIKISKGFDVKSDAYKLAEKLEKRLESGKKVTDKQKGHLVSLAQQEAQKSYIDKAKDVINNEQIKDATEKIKTKMLEKGEGKTNVNEVAEIISKTLSGEKTSIIEKVKLKTNKVAQDVLKQMYEQDSSQEWIKSVSDVVTENTQAQKTTLDAIQDTVDFSKNVVFTNANGESLNARFKSIKEFNSDKTIDIELTNGEVVNSKAISFTDSTLQSAIDYASTYNVETANAFVSAYNQNQDINAYALGFSMAYDLGKTGMTFYNAKQLLKSSVLTDSQSKVAFELGAVDNKKQVEEKEQKAKKKGTNKVGTFDDSAIKGIKLNSKQKASIQVLKTLTAFGINIKITNSKVDKQGKFVDENGSYSAKTNTISIDINAGAETINDLTNVAMLRTASHELVHYIRYWSPKQYEILKDFVLETYNNYGEEKVAQLVAMKKEQYGENKSYEFLLEEVVASACEMMLKDSKAITQLAQEHYTLAEKIKAFIDAFVEKIKKAFEGVSSRSIEAMVIEDALSDLTQMQEIFDNALIEAVHNSREVINDEIIYDENGDMMFELREGDTSIKEQLRNHLDELNKEVPVANVNTPKKFKNIKEAKEWVFGILKKTGYQVDRQGFGKIIFDEKRINTALNYAKTPEHISAFAVLPHVLKRGVQIDGHDNHKNRGYDTITIGAPVILNGIRGNMAIAVSITNHNYYKMHRIVMPDGSQFIFKNEKNRAEPSGATSKVDAVTSTTDSVSTNSITNPDEIVKKEKRVNSELEAKYLELAKEPEKNKDKLQRMVDEAAKKAGYVVKAYHGTPNGDFTVFRNWQYFTESKEYADVYQNQGASSNGYKLTANNPKTYSVYLKQDKIFDTRNEKEKRIFENKFYRQWGNGAPLSEKGLPDWTDGDDFVEFFEENDYDYDAILLDEGATGGFGDEVKSRGISIVVKNSNQIKSADPVVYDDDGNVIPLSKRFDETNDDIRYEKRTQFNDEQHNAIYTNAVKKHFGVTYNWNEVGYILTDGSKLDFSGKNMGARGGSRTVDHREINQFAFEEDNEFNLYLQDLEGSKKIIDFLNRGNIRIMPETAGIELSVKPTEQQITQLKNFVSRNNGEVTLDISDEKGNVVASLEYPKYIKSDVVINDIVDYFDKGRVPQEFESVKYEKREIVSIDGTNYGIGVYLDSEVLDDLSDEKREETVKKHIKNLAGTPFSAFDNNNNEVKIKVAPKAKYTTENGKPERANRHLTNFLDNKQKQEVLILVDELIATAKFKGKEPAKHKHGWIDDYGRNDWDVWKTYIQDKENTIWEAKLQVSNSTNGEKILYDVHPIKKVGQGRTLPKAPTNKRIPQKNEFVKDYSSEQSLKEKRQFTPAQKVARRILKTSDVADLESMYVDVAEKLEEIYSLVDDGKNASEQTKALANEIFDNMVVSNKDNQELYTTLLQTVKDYRIKITDEMKLGFGDAWSDFVKQNGVRLGLSYKGKNSVDVIYNDLSNSDYGETSYFSSEAQGQAEQLREIVSLLDALKTRPNIAHTYDMSEEDKQSVIDSVIEDIRNEYEYYQKQSEKDIDYSDNSNRSLLVNALKSATKTENEMKKLDDYHRAIKKLNNEEKALRQINAKIRDLYIYGAQNSESVIKDLQLQAEKIAKNIDWWDKRLLSIEATKPIKDLLAREKKKAVAKVEQKSKEKLEQYQEQSAQEQARLVREFKDKTKKRIESRKTTELKAKIINTLNKIDSWAKSNNKDKHIPLGFEKVVESLNFAIDRTYVDYDAIINSLNERLGDPKKRHYDNKAKRRETEEEIKEKIAKVENRKERSKNALTELNNFYSELGKRENADKRVYDETIASAISDVVTLNKPLYAMNSNELQKVYECVVMVKTAIVNQNKLFKEQRGMTLESMARAVRDDIESMGVKERRYINDTFTKARNAKTKFATSLLKPAYLFDMLGKNSYSIYKSMRKGQDVFANDIYEARDKFQKVARATGYFDWNDPKDYREVKLSSGKTLNLNVEELMMIYIASKRDQYIDHLTKGGIVIERVQYKHNKQGKVIEVIDETPTPLTYEDIFKISGMLSKSQKMYANNMQKYLADDLGAKGNEITEQLWGIHKFVDKTYFPIKSSEKFLENQSKAVNEKSIKNFGAAKDIIEGANNPVVISSFTEVWNKHVQEMALFHSFALEVEDANRVFDYKFWETEVDGFAGEKKSRRDGSMRVSITNAFGGNHINDAIHSFIVDLNGGVRDNGSNWWKSLLSKFKKNAVFFSLSVIAQQPSAIGRATAEVNDEYFWKTTLKGRGKNTWEEVKKYAPIAKVKEMGSFDTSVGVSDREFVVKQEVKDYKGLSKVKGVLKNRDDYFAWLAQKADEITWCHIWNAVKLETKTKYPSLSGEALLNKAGERFTEVIDKTQVYDSVFARPEMMRKKDFWSQSVTSFMAEPLTTLNMLTKAGRDFNKTGGKRKFAKTLKAFLWSAILNSALQSLVNAMRGQYDDDDETFWEAFLGELLQNFLDYVNPLSYIPFVKDLGSLIQGYDVERPDMSIISKLTETLFSLFDEDISVEERVTEFLSAVGAFIDVPIKNFVRDAKGIINTYFDFTDDTKTTASGIAYALQRGFADSFFGKVAQKFGYEFETDKTARLVDAYIKNDKKQADRLYNEIFNKKKKETDKSNKDIKKDITSSIKEEIKDRFLSEKINKSQAENLVNKYIGLDEVESNIEVTSWTSYNFDSDDDGINDGFDNDKDGEKDSIPDSVSLIKASYVAGKISIEQAMGMYKKLKSVKDGDKYRLPNENEVFWKQKEWEYYKENGTGDDVDEFSRYILLDKAFESENYNDIYSNVDDLIEYYTGSKTETKDILSGVKRSCTDRIKLIYKNVDKNKAVRIMAKLRDRYGFYSGEGRTEDIYDYIEKWEEQISEGNLE